MINKFQYKVIRHVFLNNKTHIGDVIRFYMNDRYCIGYLKFCNKEHFYRKALGYAIQKDVFNGLVIKDRIEFIIIKYKLVSGDFKYLLSTIDQWLLREGNEINYTTYDGDICVLHGSQKWCPEMDMKVM